MRSTSDQRVHRAMVATYVAFAGAGVALASWASRIPQIRDRLRLEPSALGLVLLAGAVGSLVSLPLAGPTVSRFGPRRTVAAGATLLAVALTTVAFGYRIGVAPVVVGLFLFGVASGGWDVAMNVHGAYVEQLLGRSIMSRFHAGFSLGTVAGALIGAAMVAGGVSVTVHLLVTVFAVAAAVVVAATRFIPLDHGRTGPTADGTGRERPPAAHPDDRPARRGAFASWREPRTLLIGVFVLAFAFAEGVGNDWIAVAVIDRHHAPQAVGTLTFAVFLASMTTGRWFGPALLDRHGRVTVVRAIAVLGIAGTMVFALAPTTWVAMIGAVLWGVGASLGFPVGMSAGADESAFAAGRVSVISSIGYGAFLAGPPLIGFLGDHVTVAHAVAVVAVLFALAAAIAPTVEPPVAVPD